MKIHKLLDSQTRSGGRIYCGATALMAISGRGYDEIQEKINLSLGRKPTQRVLGMTNDTNNHVLFMIGFKASQIDGINGETLQNKTLNRFLNERPDSIMKDMLLINTTGHYVTVCGDQFIDNHTKIPVFVGMNPHGRSRVKKVFIINHR